MKKPKKQGLQRAVTRGVTALGGSLARVAPDLENAYLRARPDVKRAVASGMFRSGMHHWLSHGAKETSTREAVNFARKIANHVLDRDASLVALPLNQTSVAGQEPPSAWDEAAYLHYNPDVRESVERGRYASGYAHFIRDGGREGRAFRSRIQRFDPIPNGWDDEAYLALHPDLRAGIASGFFQTGFEHWVWAGSTEGRSTPVPKTALPLAPEDWNEEAYLALNPGVRRLLRENKFRDGYEHWIKVGAVEGKRLPGRQVEPPATPSNWDENTYLRLYPAVRDAIREGYFRSGFEHWLTMGVFEGRQLCVRKPPPAPAPKGWDEDAYLRHNPDVTGMVKEGIYRSGFDHWMHAGASEGRELRGGGAKQLAAMNAPGASIPDAPEDWNDEAYTAMYNDVALGVKSGSYRNGWDHWLAAGKQEGRCYPPKEGLTPPASWNERAYLNMNPEVKEGVKTGFFGSGYAHWWAYGRKEGRRAPLAVPDWLTEEMRMIARIEPKLYPCDTYFDSAVEHQPAQKSKAGIAFLEVLDEVGNDRYTHVILLPWMRRGGADLVALWHARALSEHYDARVLVITTEEADHPWAGRLPAAVTHLDFGAHMSKVTEDDKVRAMARLMLKLKPRVIHNLNSATGWDLMRKHGRALKAQSNLYVSLFCWSFESDGEPVGYARLLEDVWPHLSGIISDNLTFPQELSELYGVPKELFTGCHYPTPFRPRFSYTGNAAPRVLWAGRLDSQKRPDVLLTVAKASPQVIFDVYGTALFESSPGVLEAVEGLTRLANVNMCGSFDGFDSIPTQDYVCMLYTTFYDGLPNVILEALAAGLCVMAPNVGGIHEAVGRDSRFLLNPEATAADYKRVLNWAIRHPKEVSQERTRRLRHMEKNHNFGNFCEVLQHVVGYLDGVDVASASDIDTLEEARIEARFTDLDKTARLDARTH